MQIREETTIVLSVVKWVFLATVAGALVGLSSGVFLKLLAWSSAWASQYPYYYVLLPLALFLSVVIVQYLAPEAEGHGTEKVIEAVHKRSGKIRAVVVPVKLAATLVTVAAGGSVGKEGPCAQIGGGLSSILADLLRFDDADRKKLVICGISAGFASVFGTPIAGAIMGVEVLFVGGLLYDVLLPSFIAGITAYHVSSSLGVTYFCHPIAFVPVFHEMFFLKVVVAGVFLGLCSVIMVEGMNLGKALSARLKVWLPLRGLVGGALLVVLTWICSKQYLGLGLDTIESILKGGKVVWYAFLLKVVFTSVTLNFGGSGGIVTPIFFVGACAGSLFASMMGLDSATFAAIGVTALLAGCANTPIAASIMAVELFGPAIGPYAAAACVISFLVTGYRSVYPSQVLGMKKAPAIQVELGKTLDEIHLEIPHDDTHRTGWSERLLKALAKRLGKK